MRSKSLRCNYTPVKWFHDQVFVWTCWCYSTVFDASVFTLFVFFSGDLVLWDKSDLDSAYFTFLLRVSLWLTMVWLCSVSHILGGVSTRRIRFWRGSLLHFRVGFGRNCNTRSFSVTPMPIFSPFAALVWQSNCSLYPQLYHLVSAIMIYFRKHCWNLRQSVTMAHLHQRKFPHL